MAMRYKFNLSTYVREPLAIGRWGCMERFKRGMLAAGNRQQHSCMPRRDEVTGEWRRLHNEELNDLYSSPNIVRGDKIEKNEMGWACSMYGRGEGVYRVLLGKPE